MANWFMQGVEIAGAVTVLVVLTHAIFRAVTKWRAQKVKS
jgi:hypothetical protein